MAATKSDPTYTLYYHPIPFRGRFVTSLLSYTNTPFKESTTAELQEVKSSGKVTIDFFAPPVLFDHEEDVYIGQMPAIVMHLGLKLNLMPSINKQAQCLKVVLDCNDVLCEITRNNGNQMWDNEAWKEFVDPEGRFIRWLQIFDKGGLKNGLTSDNGWYMGSDEPTIADLSIWSLWITMEKSFPRLSSFLRSNAPVTFALCDRLTAKSPALQSLIGDESSIYCGGFIEKSIRSMIE